MNNINDYRSGLINPDNLPNIDLHGETRDITRVRVSEFIKDNYKEMYIRWSSMSSKGFYE